MAQIKLDAARLSDTAALLVKNCNLSVCDKMEELAAVLRPLVDSDPSNMLEGFLDICKKVQAMYNESYRPSLQKLSDEFIEHFDLAEAVAKKSVGQAATVDTEFAVDQIDKSSIL